MARKRLAGEGTIFQDGRGHWIGRVPNPDYPAEGEPYFQKKSLDLDKVKDWVAETKARLLRGLEPEVGRSETLAEFLPRWLEAMGPTWKPRTRTGYRQIVETHLLSSRLAERELRRLTPPQVQGFLNECTHGRKAGTVRNIRACLRSALGQAQAWGLVDRNVADRGFKIKLPKDRQPFEMVPLQKDEGARLLEAVRRRPPDPSSYRRRPRVAWDRLSNLWPVLLTQGLRLSEGLALRWCDVDFERGTLRVEWTLYRAPAAERTPTTPPWELQPPKSRQSRRTLELQDEARAALVAQRDRQAFERRTLAEAYPDHGGGGFIFPDEAGEPYSTKAAEYDFGKLLERAGLDRRRIHDLRHAFGTYSIEAEVPERVVQANMGHANASTTRIYTHVVEDMQKAAAAKLNGFFREHGIGAGAR
jgi:integrase